MNDIFQAALGPMAGIQTDVTTVFTAGAAMLVLLWGMRYAKKALSTISSSPWQESGENLYQAGRDKELAEHYASRRRDQENNRILRGWQELGHAGGVVTWQKAKGVKHGFRS